jgi:hypothetical protein
MNMNSFSIDGDLTERMADVSRGFAEERQSLEDMRLRCTDPELLQFYTEKISILRSAELMSCELVVIAGRFDWACISKLKFALYACLGSPNRDTLLSAWIRIINAVDEIIIELNKVSDEELARQRNITMRTKAEADEAESRADEAKSRADEARSRAIAADRQAHNWLWRIFH